jgi:hypothetical protein
VPAPCLAFWSVDQSCPSFSAGPCLGQSASGAGDVASKGRAPVNTAVATDKGLRGVEASRRRVGAGRAVFASGGRRG